MSPLLRCVPVHYVFQSPARARSESASVHSQSHTSMSKNMEVALGRVSNPPHLSAVYVFPALLNRSWHEGQ